MSPIQNPDSVNLYALQDQIGAYQAALLPFTQVSNALQALMTEMNQEADPSKFHADNIDHLRFSGHYHQLAAQIIRNLFHEEFGTFPVVNHQLGGYTEYVRSQTPSHEFTIQPLTQAVKTLKDVDAVGRRHYAAAQKIEDQKVAAEVELDRRRRLAEAAQKAREEDEAARREAYDLETEALKTRLGLVAA